MPEWSIEHAGKANAHSNTEPTATPYRIGVLRLSYPTLTLVWLRGDVTGADVNHDQPAASEQAARMWRYLSSLSDGDVTGRDPEETITRTTQAAADDTAFTS